MSPELITFVGMIMVALIAGGFTLMSGRTSGIQHLYTSYVEQVSKERDELRARINACDKRERALQQWVDILERVVVDLYGRGHLRRLREGLVPEPDEE